MQHIKRYQRSLLVVSKYNLPKMKNRYLQKRRYENKTDTSNAKFQETQFKLFSLKVEQPILLGRIAGACGKKNEKSGSSVSGK